MLSIICRNQKLAPKWSGPHKILRLKGECNVELLLRHNNKKLIVHVNRLKPYFVPKSAAVEHPTSFQPSEIFTFLSLIRPFHRAMKKLECCNVVPDHHKNMTDWKGNSWQLCVCINFDLRLSLCVASQKEVIFLYVRYQSQKSWSATTQNGVNSAIKKKQ